MLQLSISTNTMATQLTYLPSRKITKFETDLNFYLVSKSVATAKEASGAA